MKGFGKLAGYVAVLGAAAYALYASADYSDPRSIGKWAAATAVQSEQAGPPLSRATTSPEQRLGKTPASCASYTWPNVPWDCITGRLEPAKPVDRAAAIIEREPEPLPKRVRMPSSAEIDPVTTGSLGDAPALARKPAASPAAITPLRQAQKSKQPRVHARAKHPPATRKEARGRTSRPQAETAATDGISDPIQFRLAQGGGN
jgi:hypothetical protein